MLARWDLYNRVVQSTSVLANFFATELGDSMSVERRDFLKILPIGIAVPGVLFRASASLAGKLEDSFQIPDFSSTSEPVRFWPADEPVTEEGYVVPSLDEYRAIVRSLTGPKDPYPSEIKLGNKLVAQDIPESGATPYDIAHRFYLWRKGKVGETKKEKKIYSAYAREWPTRGNPLIMQFFTEATGLRNPKGDTTYWCSAFVCWCIMRARTKAGDAKAIWPKKNGAASASYRSWEKKTTAPKRGDLAVFKRTDKSWAGHIGFVHKVDSKYVWVLGGNQGAQNDYNGGEVNIARYRRSGGGRLVLHSFRTSDYLHTPA
jgi:uncharacterized protein (TIGR02594 family)